MSKLGKLFGGKKKKPAPLPPVPTREDPEVEAARKRSQQAAKLRIGRAANVLTARGGDDDDSSIRRPGARSAKLLGK